MSFPTAADATASYRQAAEAAAHWDGLAKSERDMAAWEAALGRFAGAYTARAETYERTASSLWLEAATGQAHCSCHLTPRPDCLYGGMGIRL